MFPQLALIAAALGLLLILFLVYREQKSETASAERNMLLVVSILALSVAAWHVFASGGGH
jgi:multisubunit Na+/H+ antiporter MnhB subunit